MNRCRYLRHCQPRDHDTRRYDRHAPACREVPTCHPRPLSSPTPKPMSVKVRSHKKMKPKNVPIKPQPMLKPMPVPKTKLITVKPIPVTKLKSVFPQSAKSIKIILAKSKSIPPFLFFEVRFLGSPVPAWVGDLDVRDRAQILDLKIRRNFVRREIYRFLQ